MERTIFKLGPNFDEHQALQGPKMQIGVFVCDSLLGGHPKVRVAKCHIFYTEQIFQIKFYPIKSALIATNLTLQLNEIERDGYFKGKSIKYGWFKDKTTLKLVKLTPKLLHFNYI